MSSPGKYFAQHQLCGLQKQRSIAARLPSPHTPLTPPRLSAPLVGNPLVVQHSVDIHPRHQRCTNSTTSTTAPQQTPGLCGLFATLVVAVVLSTVTTMPAGTSHINMTVCNQQASPPPFFKCSLRLVGANCWPVGTSQCDALQLPFEGAAFAAWLTFGKAWRPPVFAIFQTAHPLLTNHPFPFICIAHPFRRRARRPNMRCRRTDNSHINGVHLRRGRCSGVQIRRHKVSFQITADCKRVEPRWGRYG